MKSSTASFRGWLHYVGPEMDKLARRYRDLVRLFYADAPPDEVATRDRAVLAITADLRALAAEAAARHECWDQSRPGVERQYRALLARMESLREALDRLAEGC